MCIVVGGCKSLQIGVIFFGGMSFTLSIATKNRKYLLKFNRIVYVA